MCDWGISGNKLARHLVEFQERLTIIIQYYFHFDTSAGASHISNTIPTVCGIVMVDSRLIKTLRLCAV